ncbi:conserved hypothetical protein [Segniliparus rotundus DSM 44985]|uniref:DUF4328 domain-containing protein n=1 Tax=Segniliparus rotundus (strain ATCC BAA-972 / CDC 1076 / CIP 108378 / DSM 44985 / JCM 13578) TaxID=640132 RepID=D6ZDY3_SEGRD|nr:DUF4328 domain-containing protein [Segniliparus rotundus]ADG99390.1 conserved hypothetical protein [Segniliparus rotundus DSM 44985]
MTFPQPAGPPSPQRPHLPGLSGHWPSQPPPIPPDRTPTQPAHGPNPRIPVIPPGYRWQASRPPSAIPPRTRPPRPPSPTPRYASPPRWGLVQHFPHTPSGVAAHEKPARTALIEAALAALAGLLGLFAFSEALRYALAFYGREHLLPGPVVAASGALLGFAFWASLVLIVATQGALAWWLWLEREIAYTANNRVDPRRWWEILLLAAAPAVNVVTLGVLLKELLAEHERGGRRAWQSALQSWWIWWAGAHLAVLGLALWLFDTSVQARTEALLLGAVVGVVLVFLAVRTRALVVAIDSSSDPAAADQADRPVRWVIAAGAAKAPESAPAE